MRQVWILTVVLAACGNGGAKKDDTIENVQGTASIAGKPAKITSCKPVKKQDGQVTYTVIELGLDSGHTVGVDGYMGHTIRKGSGEPQHLSDCSRSRVNSTDGGQAPKPWGKGSVGLTCTTADGELVLDATYDCGAKDRPSNRVD